MRIVFVRHGHPNYKDDCLTELGQSQAAAAAERVKDEGIQKIYSSSCGRAYETAEHTAKLLNQDIEKCDFMREIGWGNKEVQLPEGGHPWRTVRLLAEEGRDLLATDWRETEPFCQNRIIEFEKTVAENIDAWLETLGYKREGLYYRVGKRSFDTVAMFSHGGSSSVALSHIFNLPLPFFCSAIRPGFTAVTVVKFQDEEGKLVAPEFEILNDVRHIMNTDGEVVFDN